MARTIRSESSANQAMYLASLKNQTRDDWRAILAKRDQKRIARHYRQARRPLIGSAGLARIGAMVFAIGLGVTGAAALFLSLSA